MVGLFVCKVTGVRGRYHPFNTFHPANVLCSKTSSLPIIFRTQLSTELTSIFLFPKNHRKTSKVATTSRRAHHQRHRKATRTFFCSSFSVLVPFFRSVHSHQQEPQARMSWDEPLRSGTARSLHLSISASLFPDQNKNKKLPTLEPSLFILNTNPQRRRALMLERDGDHQTTWSSRQEQRGIEQRTTRKRKKKKR